MAGRLRKFFVTNNMRQRLLQIISLLIFASAILVSVLSYLRFVSSYTEQSAADVQQLVEQVALNVDNYLDELAHLCLSPYYNTNVMKRLDRVPTSEQEALGKRREIENYLRQVMISPRKDILRVYILADSIYSSTRTSHIGITSRYVEEPWYLESLTTDDYIFLPIYSEQAGASSYLVFSIAKRICSLQDNSKTLGVIRVDANYSGIKAVCDRVNVNAYGALLIMDPNGNIIYINSKLPADLTTEQIRTAAQENDFCTQELNGTSYIINSQSVSSMGWQVIAINSKAEITKGAQATLVFNMIFAIGMAGIGVVISAFFINRYLDPLYKTVNLMEKVQAGDLSIRADTNCTDEIAYLNGAFNRMLTQIQEMIVQENQLTKQVYKAKYLQKGAQFEALYRQIQPHFLFNTLNSISILAKCGRTAEVIQSIDELAILLRGMVNTDREISLEAELKITESYLRLQQLRHDAPLYDIRTHGVDLSHLLPALTLQPIVENALIHGCESVQGNAFIQIDLWYEGDRLIIAVHDNGAGIEPAVLSQLQKRLNCDEGQEDEVAHTGGIGLTNIQARIRHKFGNSYGITVQSKVGAGTTVTMLLPRRDRNADCADR